MTLGEFFTLLGFLTGALVLWRWSRAQKLDTQGMKTVALAGIVGGVAGAKITQWIVGEGALAGAMLNPHSGGKSLVGGLVCGWLAVEIAKRVLGIRRSTGDGWALALPAGEAVGRIGCFFNGCCYGTRCDASWAIYQHGAWRHPTQLYSGAAAALIFAVVWFSRGQMKREGDGFQTVSAALRRLALRHRVRARTFGRLEQLVVGANHLFGNRRYCGHPAGVEL